LESVTGKAKIFFELGMHLLDDPYVKEAIEDHPATMNI